MIGTITKIAGVGQSVIQLHIQDVATGQRTLVPAEGNATLNALEDAYGTLADAIGQSIRYELTDFGSLAHFAPENP